LYSPPQPLLVGSKERGGIPLFLSSFIDEGPSLGGLLGEFSSAHTRPIEILPAAVFSPSNCVLPDRSPSEKRKTFPYREF